MISLDHICFLGTPDFSVPVLLQLRKYFPNSKLSVITMPDRVRGRGSSLSASPVGKAAEQLTLPVFKPRSKVELTSCISHLKPSIIIVVAYGMILEKVVTDTYFCLNIHSSLLPKYRGASPIHTALLNGDHITGISLIKMNEYMDDGDIVYQKELRIEDHDNLGGLTKKLSLLGAESCIDFLKNHVLNDTIFYQPQLIADVTYSQKINKSDLLIESFDNLELVHQKIRAYSPKPAAYTIHSGRRIKLLSSAFKNGNFELLYVQPEGKSIMSYSDFLLGASKGLY